MRSPIEVIDCVEWHESEMRPTQPHPQRLVKLETVQPVCSSKKDNIKHLLAFLKKRVRQDYKIYRIIRIILQSCNPVKNVASKDHASQEPDREEVKTEMIKPERV